MENEKSVVPEENVVPTPVTLVTPVVVPETANESTQSPPPATDSVAVNSKAPKDRKYGFAVVVIVLIFLTIIITPYISNYLRVKEEEKAEATLTAKETCRFKDKITDTTIVLYYGRDKLKQYTKRVITTYDDEQHLNSLNNACKVMSDTVKKDKSILTECSNEQGTQTTTYQVNYQKVDASKYQSNSSFTLDYSKDKSVQEIIAELKRKGYTCS